LLKVADAKLRLGVFDIISGDCREARLKTVGLNDKTIFHGVKKKKKKGVDVTPKHSN